MRQSLWIILLAIVLVLPFILRPAVTKASSTRASGRLVILTPHNQDIRREYARAFSHWHETKYGETIDIDYRVPGGTNDARRLLEHNYNAWRDPKTGKLPSDMPAEIDVIWGGGDFFFDVELKSMGVLQPLDLDPKLLAAAFPSDSLAGVRLYEGTRTSDGRSTPLWVGVCLSSFGIVYNPDVYRRALPRLRQPDQWNDLTDERLAGWLALADPTHSGSAAFAYMMVIQKAMANAEKAFLDKQPRPATRPIEQIKRDPDYRAAIGKGWKNGMRQLLLIAANARYFTDSSPIVPNDVGNGEAAAGVAIDFYGRVYQEIVGPERCRFIAPAGATAISPDPVAVLHGVTGRQRVLADRFVEFLLTPEGQKLWMLKPDPADPYAPKFRSLRRPPIRRDVYADRSRWAENVNPYVEAGGFNHREEWTRPLTETRMIWTAAWIDSRDDLLRAYENVRKLGKGKLKRNLRTRLSNIPVTFEDIEAMRVDRKKAEAEGRGSEWRAQQRILWSKKFAGHFRRVAREGELALSKEKKTRRKAKVK